MKAVDRKHFIFFSCVLLFFISCGGTAFSMPSSYFNMHSTRSENVSPFTKWTGMMGRFEKHRSRQNGECGKTRFNPCSINDWKALLRSIESKPLRAQLEVINNWSNKHPYIEDLMNWGIEDYWAMPPEFMEVSGDCEDYAISKYYSLRSLGVSADKLRIMVVQDLNLGGIIHAVLGVYDGNELLILDNQIKQVTPAMKIFHYRPVYGINEDAWWSYHPKVN